MRPALIGGAFGALFALLFTPLVSGLLLLGLLVQGVWLIGVALIDGPDMADSRVAATIKVVEVVAGPHRSAMPRHGEMITVALKNTSRFLHTKADDGNQDSPLYLACGLSGTLIRDHVVIGSYARRVVVMKMDWILGADSEPTFPVIRPGQTLNVDFSTNLDGDFEPIGPNEQFGACVVGGDKGQALLQMNVSVSDRNRAHPYHYIMSTVTQAGKDQGFAVSP